ncbi:MAG TPA: hypothetical protein VFY29_00815 [Terriglobia bacterium]|nr:hypothetical protein [Terriglobia bacterium]
MRVWTGLVLALAGTMLLAFPETRAFQVSGQFDWKCVRGSGEPCEQTDLVDPRFRQILILSTAYRDGSANTFWRDFGRFVARLGSRQMMNAWSAQKRDRILYVGVFTGGGPLDSGNASFGAHVREDITGTRVLAARSESVHQFVDQLQARAPWLDPLGVALLFQSGNAMANSTPPSFSSRSYGITRIGSDDLRNGYIGAHELGHGALNFLDEYVESGLENLNIRNFDVLTPLLIFTPPGSTPPPDGYDYRLSEILAGNGPVNLAPRPDVTTVRTPGAAPQRFEYEGGLFFGRGTFHDAGSNLMNSDFVQRGPGDGFAFDHSPAQQEYIDSVFGDAPSRANDRLRNVGPVDGWPGEFGASTTVMLYDADKNNPRHPTKEYVVQVGWWEHQQGADPRWRVDSYTVPATKQTVDLPLSAGPREKLLLAVACRAGMTELSDELNGRDVCDRENSNRAVSLRFYTPYESTTVPASQWFTTYWWRFRTFNGSQYSGWTGWSSFYRSF